MSLPCPTVIDGANVVCSVILNPARHRYTGTTVLRDENGEQRWFHGLAVARYDGGSTPNDVYLFYCDEAWETENDSCYSSIDEAVQEARRQFGVSIHDWVVADWPFDQTPNTACLTTKPVMSQRRPILTVQHFEDDHSWAFICGTTNANEDVMLVAMSEAVEMDSSLFTIADLPPGWNADRAGVGSPWIRRKYEE